MPQAKPRIPTVGEQHAEWLNVLRPDGPFLGISVLSAVFPQGLEAVPTETRRRLRQAWAEFSEAPDLLASRWQTLVLDEVLRFPDSVIVPSQASDYGDTRPDAVVLGPGQAARLHLYRRPAAEPVTTAVKGLPALTERAAQVCRDKRVPVALVTNGRLWALVHARPGETTSVAVFDADLWSEEPVLLQAFASLLSVQRVLPAPVDAAGEPTSSLAALFVRSAADHAQVTTTLGIQVRQAVELFVAELARLDRESDGRLLRGVSERDIYRAGLTVLMRMVFLLYAEEHKLLPVNDPIYLDGYAISTIFGALVADRTLHGDEIGDRRTAAWPRLMALFAAIHSGCSHPDLRIPPYGGSLFNPLPFPWLADAAVTDRVVRKMLDALLVLKHRGKAAEQLSYAGLAVEQIGHVYEGLLEFSCLRVDEPYVGLLGKLEPELPLAELEAAAAAEDFHSWLVARCAPTPTELKKALAKTPNADQVGDLHAACDNDSVLAERVRPFWGLLRMDLRGAPTVFPAKSVLFTQVGDRRATGTHYTPKPLAAEVVEHTLAPLCFNPGPADGAEPVDWRVRPASELLALKVVDPAMGSGAFLVSACEYLAVLVARAWERDGMPEEVSGLLGDDPDGVLLAARRTVASRCLYGVDRDDMAVELAKLSLWLVTLAKDQPFGFLDHALRCGDSLVGLLSQDQLERFHLDPRIGSEAGSNLFRPLHDQIKMTIDDVVDLRMEIEADVVRDAKHAAEKAEKLELAQFMTRKLKVAADAIVGAALSTAVRHAPWYAEDNDETFEDRLDKVADDVSTMLRWESPVEAELMKQLSDWLTGWRPTALRPFHWPLEFPEVMRRGGFDAVVGNPPFIGGQRLTGAIGKDVREYLKTHVAAGKPGSADLCSYFLLRNVDITWGGRVGIIATNTIAQGDTREVGLDQVTDNGMAIYRAEKSQPWPGTASLEVSLVWVGQAHEREARILNGRRVPAITATLDPISRVTGNPHRLASNDSQSFVGSYVHGLGFLLTESEARQLIEQDPINKDVLFLYLNGEDLNSRADCTASRWVINFHDWPIEDAAEYEDCFAIVEAKVKHERAKNADKRRREIWWRFTRPTIELYEAVALQERMLVIARVSKTGLPVWVPTGQVPSEQVIVFAVNRDAYLTLLSSNIHFAWWTIKGESTMRTDARYTPSDGFETFPQPELTERMDRVGEELHRVRAGMMVRRDVGLTKLYNLVHDPAVTDDDIARLREIHVEVDRATAEAYGWEFDLGHGFHQTRQGRRFTIAPDVQVEILDLLLELNHKRYAEEVQAGLHTKKKAKGKRAPKAAPLTLDDGLFPPEGALF